MKRRIILLLALLAGSAVWAGAAAGDARHFAAEARKAYERKDYALFVRHLETALQLRPNHPAYIYNLAAGHALLGHTVVAVDALAVAAKMGLAYPKIEADPDFAGISGTPEFKTVVRELAVNLEPLVRSEVAFTVPEKGLVPEGVAYHAKEQRFFLSSVYQRKILALDRDGRVTPFSAPQDSLWSVLGMKVDEERGILWACIAAHPQMKGLRPDENGQAGLVKYDLATGKMIGRMLIAEKLRKHLLGDLVIAAERGCVCHRQPFARHLPGRAGRR